MKKLLASLLLILLVMSTLLVLTSCDNTPDNPPAESDSDSAPAGSESESETEGVEELATHKIIEDGVAKYSIIRVEKASTSLTNSIKLLHDYLNERSSEYVNIDTDYSLDYLETGKHDPDLFEIVIGNTNYEKSQELASTLSYGEYVIEASGNKIYVVSPTDEGLDTAINILLNMFSLSYDDSTKQLNISSADLKTKKVFDETLADIPVIDNGQYEFSKNGGDGSEMLVFKGTSEEDYTKYSAKLLERGYKEYMRNDSFGKNKYSMFTKGNVAVNVLYTPVDFTTRIILDDLRVTSLPEVDSDYTEAQKECDSLLIQIGTAPEDNTDVQNGECYLIRCEDGRFIIIDGGFKGNMSGKTPRNNAKRIYETIKNNTPDGMTPTIACWIFTHAHSDHTGAFADFAVLYNRSVNIDQIVYNYPLNGLNEEAWKDRASVRNRINTYFKDADVVKAHTGQVFQYANVKMEVLYTVELLWPAALRNTMNNASLVTRFHIYGQSMLMPGDMGTDANPVCIKYHGSYLKSDFYHVTHHGYTGGSNEFNKLVAPKWVLWPVGKAHYYENKNHSRNSWLSDPTSSVEQIFPAWFQTTVFELPFNGKNYTETENK